MKKQLLFICFLLGSLYSQATVHTIQVANYQFTPSSVNAVVGDTITWTWISGDHTTTCDPVSQGSGNSLPAGALTWDTAINTNSKSFSYRLAVAGVYNYWCIPHSPRMAGTIIASAILPVTLISFTTSAASNSKALLKWTVANETNVSYYSIQKSTDGRTFTEVGRTQVDNILSIQKSYTYTDNAMPVNKYIYYSLKIVDRDGKTQLSPIAMFTNKVVEDKIIISLSPNPISSPGHLMLQFNADKAGTSLAQLFDLKGALIKQINMMAVAGVNNGHMHLGELPSGTYTLIFSVDGKKETRRIQFE